MKKLWMLFLVAAIISCKDEKKVEEPLVKDATTAVETKPAPVEIADARYIDMGKTMMKDFSLRNADAYSQAMDENVRYYWSGGDSLIGRKAVADYWRGRFSELITTMSIADDLWLPAKLNETSSPAVQKGNWLLNWARVNLTYSNGKSLSFWVHTVYHYNESDKIDQVVQYYDRAPINAVLGMK